MTGKCQHTEVEEHQCSPGPAGKGVACVACHAGMTSNFRGAAFLLANRRRRIILPIPLEGRYWKAAPPAPDPMLPGSRMKGYEHIHMARR